MSRTPRPAPRPIETPWMTPAETCVYLRWLDADGQPKLHQFYIARSQYGLPASKAGGSLRCHRQFVDQWVQTGVAVPDLGQRRFKAKAPAAQDSFSNGDGAHQPPQLSDRV